MYLSDAIRLGALLHPQCFRTMYEFSNNRGSLTIVASCALGAAEQAGYRWAYSDRRLASLSRCPSCPQIRGAVGVADIVQHLNDSHHWTREAIADWVETIERASGVRAEEGMTDIVAAGPPSPSHQDGSIRESELSCV